MFLKLFKYDFKACARYEIPVLLVILGATVIGCIDTAIICLLSGSSVDSLTGGVGITVGIMGVFSAIMVCSIAAGIMTFLLYFRFYKSMVTDEAYLTLTLPVSPSQIIFAKLTSAMVWTLISGLAIIASFSSFVMCALTFTNGFDFFSEVFREFELIPLDFSLSISSVILILVLFFITAVESFLQAYMAILFGGSIARKHKALAAVGMMLLINFAVSSVASTITAFSNIELANAITGSNINSIHTSFNVYIIYQIVIYLVLSVVFFLISRYFISKKVNLE